MNIGLAIDNWVHRQAYEGSEHGTKILQMETEWKRFKEKQSEVANDWQNSVNNILNEQQDIKIHLARMEEHLKYTDRRIDDTPRPKNR